MLDVLASSALLTVFVVVALGAAVGAVKFGPLRFGAAGALFVGLALGAADERLGQAAGLGLVQSLGLALFVYTVGLAAGPAFMTGLRRQLPLMGVAVLIMVLVFTTTMAVSFWLKVPIPLVLGTFAGALTSTPALAAAAEATASGDPAIGYSIAYPIGVILTIVIVAILLTRTWPGLKDVAALTSSSLDAASAHVEHAVNLREVPGWADGQVRLSYLQRGDRTRVIAPGEDLFPGDRVVVVGPAPAVTRAIEFLGTRLEHHLADDRTAVDFNRFVVSNKQVAGRTVAELSLPARFGGVLTRVRRGDTDLLARDDLVLELGDRVLAVVPEAELDRVSQFFGDSERRVSEIDALTVGIGMALGLLLGLVTIPLPGGGSFALGPAAGPLIVGMILGATHRIGPLIWGLPHAANLTIRQLGLLFFLATVGLASGPAFASQAFTPMGATLGGIAVLIVLLTGASMWVGGRLLGLSAPRTAGSLAGLVGQPAILAYAQDRLNDDRIESGYAALFALGIISKIALVAVGAAFM